jgi:antitoxin component of MazEF toxin-antitoxin module
MAKLVKQKYYNANGEAKVNNYAVNIPKKIVEESKIKETDEIKIYVENGKIVIERA